MSRAKKPPVDTPPPATPAPSAAVEDLDAPEPVRLLSEKSGSWRLRRLATSPDVAPMALERNLGTLSPDSDTEDTPPTAYPGQFRFEGLEDDDDEPVPEDDASEDEAPEPVAEAPVVDAPPAEPAAAVAPPVAAAVPAPVAAPAAEGGLPGLVWLVLALVAVGGAVWFFVGGS